MSIAISRGDLAPNKLGWGERGWPEPSRKLWFSDSVGKQKQNNKKNGPNCQNGEKIVRTNY